jgi:hypothetical protein
MCVSGASPIRPSTLQGRGLSSAIGVLRTHPASVEQFPENEKKSGRSLQGSSPLDNTLWGYGTNRMQGKFALQKIQHRL